MLARYINCTELKGLAAQILAENRVVRMRVRGYSMIPFIREGDILEIQPLKNQTIRRGDVVMCVLPDRRLVIHRVVQVRGYPGHPSFLMQGDAACAPDGIVTGSQILGRVGALERSGRRRMLDNPCQRSLVWLWLNLSPFTRQVYSSRSIVHHRLGELWKKLGAFVWSVFS